MKAYAVLDGGGVKGAALVGCLRAAEEQGIEFVGYGGTSAGALIGCLAAAGYSAAELHRIVIEELNFADLLQGASSEITRIKRALNSRLTWVRLVRDVSAIYRIYNRLGLCDGGSLTGFLRDKLVHKLGPILPTLKTTDDISFADFYAAGCKPLKIVATDLHERRPRVFFDGDQNSETGGSVLRAVRASAGYPFVFQPVSDGKQYLVDGGLSSNLPVFLFEAERRRDGLPVIAFDLIPTPAPARERYGFAQFCRDMLDTALESGDFILRQSTRGVYHVPILVPTGINTFDLDLKREQVDALYHTGLACAHSYFARTLPQWAQASNLVERLQATTGLRTELVSPVLEAFCGEVERGTSARETRANIMLPTPSGTRIIVYQYGMDADADADLELAAAGGCSGRAWMTRKPHAADLNIAQKSFKEEWGMRSAEQNKVRPDRKALISFPVFDLSAGDRAGATSVDELPLLAVLSVDSSTSLQETGWVGDSQEMILATGKRWADIVSRLMT